MDPQVRKTLAKVAEFYDARKVGDVGPLGFRRSTDLTTLSACMDRLLGERIVVPDKTLFLDLGCADGRVNLFMSYLAKMSVGVELDEWTLDEYGPLRSQLQRVLGGDRFLLPPQNIALFHGDSTDEEIHQEIKKHTGFGFEDFDVFYTYLVMQEEFARMVNQRAKPGAVFMIYGLCSVLPRYEGLQLLEELSPIEGVLALYRKV